MTFNLDDFAMFTFLPGISDQRTAGFAFSFLVATLSILLSRKTKQIARWNYFHEFPRIL
jgi:hypothetical protein